MLQRIPIWTVALLLLACGGTSENADFLAACETAGNMPPEICSCAADRAREELSPGGYAFVVAMLGRDDARLAELRGELDVGEMTSAGMFLVGAAGRCASEASE